jgi:hypothetical protein
MDEPCGEGRAFVEDVQKRLKLQMEDSERMGISAAIFPVDCRFGDG